MTKKLIWGAVGVSLSLALSIGAAILWATPQDEISLKAWIRGLLRG